MEPSAEIPTPEATRRTGPNGRQVRGAHRQSLVIHFVIGVSALLSLVVVNRLVSPGTLWVHWAALGWGVLFVAHLARFERGTMATMGRKR
jgi:hypothetical protein